MVIGLRKLFRFGDLTFFDCAGVRLLLEKARDGAQPASCIYFRCADIALAVAEVEKRGGLHLPAAFRRQDGRPRSLDGLLQRSGRPHLALMQEAPKGYTPPT